MNNTNPLKTLTADPQMARILASVGEIRLVPQNIPMFHALVRSVISQQLSKKAAVSIFARFVNIFPGQRFPTPAQVNEIDFQRLTAAGISRVKSACIKGLAKADTDGSLPGLAACTALSDAEIIRLLTEIKGIGLWTAQMVLIFNLARPNVLPSTDAGIKRGFSKFFFNGEVVAPGQLEDYAHRWEPYRTLASLYIWRALDTGISTTVQTGPVG